MTIIEKAPAKINLGLDICGKCDDGYHELEMIMLSVDLNDYVTVTERSDHQVVMTSNSHRMPHNAKNDVVKAAELIRSRYGIKQGVTIDLEKRIPICAGLGGGSSDAAATLRALDKLWQLNLSKQELIELGFAIGSDVPYCLEAGCAYIAGKGEVVEPLSASLSSWVVLVKPDFGVSTRKIFKEIDVDSITRVDIAGLKKAMLTSDYDAMLSCMGNSLEDITIMKRPFIQTIKDRMLAAGADIALMSGSGPTVFALCPTAKRADRVYNAMKGFCKEVYKVRTLS
ncbi:4-(cytidine 5'-diphospho)-2-C-methyl-D-erythritol kinase [Streptococcus entericus]|uniref:4-(cytidine 5'-diphospho)-2-C-methyl-D-erythritol kinase n=1 Tax=Streptococcus entericus TaxID=155680 RepID=UPI0003664D71|nr:4-(cytidine 5'-diphospho)-2-C-methyl-D-erythritol kinase [Streptococcus entericus]